MLIASASTHALFALRDRLCLQTKHFGEAKSCGADSQSASPNCHATRKGRPKPASCRGKSSIPSLLGWGEINRGNDASQDPLSLPPPKKKVAEGEVFWLLVCHFRNFAFLRYRRCMSSSGGEGVKHGCLSVCLFVSFFASWEWAKKE